MTLAWKGSHSFPPAWKPSIPPALISGLVGPVASVDWTSSTSIPAWATFTATGLATQFDSTGKLTYRPNNLVLNSATLSTQTVTVQSGVNYVLSIKGTGSVTNSGANAATLNGTGASNRVNLAFTASTGSLTLTVSGSVTSARLSAVTYETTLRPQDDVDTTVAAYYGPRFDYTYNGAAWVAAGLLVEGAATNSTYPSTGALTGGSWTLTSVTYPSTTTGIDGVSGTAAKAVLSAGQQASTAYAISTTTSGTGVISAYAKPAGYNYLILVRGTYASGDYAIFDVNAGTVAVAPTFGGSTAVIKQFGSYWFCELRSAQNTTINAFSVSSAANTSASANGTDGVYITEFQTELGATAASSRIRTSASAVTRASETLTFSGYTSNPFAIMSAPESTGAFSCNKYADQATANAAIAAANQWVKSVKIWPVGTPSGSQSC